MEAANNKYLTKFIGKNFFSPMYILYPYAQPRISVYFNMKLKTFELEIFKYENCLTTHNLY